MAFWSLRGYGMVSRLPPKSTTRFPLSFPTGVFKKCSPFSPKFPETFQTEGCLERRDGSYRLVAVDPPTLNFLKVRKGKPVSTRRLSPKIRCHIVIKTKSRPFKPQVSFCRQQWGSLRACRPGPISAPPAVAREPHSGQA